MATVLIVIKVLFWIEPKTFLSLTCLDLFSQCIVSEPLGFDGVFFWLFFGCVFFFFAYRYLMQ